MKSVFLGGLSMLIVATTLASAPDTNPLLGAYTTPFEAPPFHLIRADTSCRRFTPASSSRRRKWMRSSKTPGPPSFANTIEALDRSGVLLTRVERIFNSIRVPTPPTHSISVANVVAPLLTANRNDVLMNEKLFRRIKGGVRQPVASFAHRGAADATGQHLQRFCPRRGRPRTDEQRLRMRKINEELSMLQLKFGQNLLKETNSWKLVVDRAEETWPAFLRLSSECGSNRDPTAGLDGKWVFTLQKPSLIPFLQYAKNRTLREKIYRAYCSRGDNSN